MSASTQRPADRQPEEAGEHKAPEDVLSLAREEGIELSDESLGQISGGWGADDSDCPPCPKCHSTKVTRERLDGHESPKVYVCLSCGHVW